MSCCKMDLKCTKCRLSKSRTQVVPGIGPRSSKIAFIGEAPGKDEDLRGEPFVGRAGKILDQALADCGVARRQVYISNLTKCRPPRNRKPRKDEIAACSEYLESELAKISPDIVCALGQTVAEQLLRTKGKMSVLTKKEHESEIGGKRVRLRVAYHPAACLYQRKNLGAFKESIKRSLEAAGLV